MTLQVRELLQRKRAGRALDEPTLRAFARAIAADQVSEAQLGAFAMAVCLRGMDLDETRALTLALRDSGECLDWRALRELGPVLDKHSTGGVGDCVSLLVAPLLAACGAYVPMLSGRGLGHSGGTLDKLEALPGYRADVDRATLQRVVRQTGLAIVGAGPALAPADRRLYAVRDVTATVDSVALITASILAKKLAGGADAVVLDVKQGSGANSATRAGAEQLAQSLVAVADSVGLDCQLLLSDMDEPLAPAIGNALEVDVCLRYLRGELQPSRLHRLSFALAALALRQGGLGGSAEQAEAQLHRALESGAAADRFAAMVRALGGPSDVLDARRFRLAQAPWRQPLLAPCAGYLRAVDAGLLGRAAVQLGAGRSQPGQSVDPRVGISQLLAVGSPVDDDSELCWLHAADAASAARVAPQILAAFKIGATAAKPRPLYRVLSAPAAAHKAQAA